MRFDGEFIVMLRDEPLRGLDLLCSQVLSDLAAGDPEEPWNDENYKLLLETYALLRSLQDSGLLPVKIATITIAGDVEGECKAIFQNLRRIQDEVRGLSAQRELEMLTRQYTAALGVRCAYEFTAGDFARLQKLLNEMRELMLSTPRLGGRAGAEILAHRPRFRGTRMKPELKQYARMLVDSGLTLGVCDWGFCVYRQEHSACLGSITGPSPLRREPSTCATCRNFAVSPRHREYWLQQVERNEALLSEPALPTQTLKIARERFNQARAVLHSIESSSRDSHHARKTSP